MSLRELGLAQAGADPRWEAMCGPGDLFCTGRWLAVEREAVGPWVPRARSCLAAFDGPEIAAGVVVQQFDRDADDETVRLDKMLPAEVLARWDDPVSAVQPSLMCGTWFNSTVLTAPGLAGSQREKVRRELVDAVVERGRQWGCATVFFPFLDADDVQLREALRDAGFAEFPAPARHIFNCDFPNYESFVASLRSHKRHRLRRESAAVRAAGISTACQALDGSTVETAARLAHLLERKYDQRSTFDEMAAWFEAIARHTDTVVFTASRGTGPPIAMSMWIHHEDRMYGFHAGFDYEQCQGLPMYSLAGFHLPIEYGCSHPGIRALEYGCSSDQAKLIRGTTGMAQVLCVKPLTALAQPLLNHRSGGTVWVGLPESIDGVTGE
ncbi:GNAT family N-acetyltransferase [Allorhizocola rhizosphaerae]|uniref:GNAT family N-acetyltransferase n=1 Tax=Allorhizocola rhizosphaerae TaxID=1872709 RepID=UPI001B8B6C5D|nr:GNAT family N-acetyltransferase [Allorhizocola rhizosphaerae]